VRDASVSLFARVDARIKGYIKKIVKKVFAKQNEKAL